MFKRLFIIACTLWLGADFVFGQRTRVRETDKEVREMADAFWIASGGISNVASWNDTGNWSIAAVPGASHDAIFDGLRSEASVGGGTTTNATVASIRTMPNYPGDVGLLGDPLYVDPDNFIVEGSGRVVYKKRGASTITRIVINSPNLVDAFRQVENDLNGGLVYMSVIGGTVILRNGEPFIRLHVAPAGLYPVHVDFLHASTAGTVIQSGGFLLAGSPVTTSIISGGHMVIEGSARPITLHTSGGLVEFTGLSLLVPSSIFMAGGTVDLSQMTTSKTISTVTLLPGSDFINPNNITVTDLTDLTGSALILP